MLTVVTTQQVSRTESREKCVPSFCSAKRKRPPGFNHLPRKKMSQTVEIFEPISKDCRAGRNVSRSSDTSTASSVSLFVPPFRNTGAAMYPGILLRGGHEFLQVTARQYMLLCTMHTRIVKSIALASATEMSQTAGRKFVSRYVCAWPCDTQPS